MDVQEGYMRFRETISRICSLKLEFDMASWFVKLGLQYN